MPTVKEVMTPDPISLPASSSVVEAASCMKDADIGPVIVLDEKDSGVCGIVTDRDITIRVVAEGRDPQSTKLGDICSKDLTTIGPDESVEQAIQVMKSGAIRRLPVVQDGKPVGIVSLGDLAVGADGEKALEGISAAPPNN